MPKDPFFEPLPGELVVSYGHRLLWHQLGLQLNNKRAWMLTEEEFVAAIMTRYPDAVERNVRQYRSYFNGIHESMGFRAAREKMPVPVEFARSPE